MVDFWAQLPAAVAACCVSQTFSGPVRRRLRSWGSVRDDSPTGAAADGKAAALGAAAAGVQKRSKSLLGNAAAAAKWEGRPAGLSNPVSPIHEGEAGEEM
jgi:hypothetical protein